MMGSVKSSTLKRKNQPKHLKNLIAQLAGGKLFLKKSQKWLPYTVKLLNGAMCILAFPVKGETWRP